MVDYGDDAVIYSIDAKKAGRSYFIFKFRPCRHCSCETYIDIVTKKELCVNEQCGHKEDVRIGGKESTTSKQLLSLDVYAKKGKPAYNQIYCKTEEELYGAKILIPKEGEDVQENNSSEQ